MTSNTTNLKKRAFSKLNVGDRVCKKTPFGDVSFLGTVASVTLRDADNTHVGNWKKIMLTTEAGKDVRLKSCQHVWVEV